MWWAHNGTILFADWRRIITRIAALKVEEESRMERFLVLLLYIVPYLMRRQKSFNRIRFTATHSMVGANSNNENATRRSNSIHAGNGSCSFAANASQFSRFLYAICIMIQCRSSEQPDPRPLRYPHSTRASFQINFINLHSSLLLRITVITCGPNIEAVPPPYRLSF